MRRERPRALFLGGDLLPSGSLLWAHGAPSSRDFVTDVLVAEFTRLRDDLRDAFPRVFLILGNDDPRSEEKAVIAGATRGLWEYVHGIGVEFEARRVYGYACVPPTPFRLKDWERYDVSRYVDPGCVPPEEGGLSLHVPREEIVRATIAEDLDALVGSDDLSAAIFLFHSPPYETALDRAALDGKTIDHVPLDPHVGSIAIRRFIETRQPLITLHGHVHESTGITGRWRESLGRTCMFQGAHDGPEVAVVRFDPDAPQAATRILV